MARYTLELARALAARFADDEYWLLTDQRFAMPENAPRNLHPGEPPRNVVEKKWWLWGLQQGMMRRHIDVFHGTDFSVPYLASRPSVMTVHDLSPWLDRTWQPNSDRIRRRTPLLLRAGLASMVITPTEAIRHAVVERFRLAADRVVAVPLAASEHFRPVVCKPAAPYFLFVGTLEPRKNLHRLVEAWREVYKTHAIDLVIAGRARADFPPLAPEPGLRLAGPVNEADLPSLYSGALAVVYPSLYEGFGLPALEAMQCGALVVTSKDPAIVEVTGDGAIQIQASDTRGLAEALRSIASEPASFASLRERAIKRAREFSWQRTAERTREVYDAAVRVFRK